MDKPLSAVIADDKARHPISGSIQATQGAAQHLPALKQFLPQANASFIHAMHVTVTISAAVAALGRGRGLRLAAGQADRRSGRRRPGVARGAAADRRFPRRSPPPPDARHAASRQIEHDLNLTGRRRPPQ